MLIEKTDKAFVFWTLLLGLNCICILLPGQSTCGVIDYEQNHNNKSSESIEQFEKWITEKIRLSKPATGHRAQADPYKVEIVVHVIHNGEEVGTGTNLSDEQIHSQIAVLNKDFNRRNEDAINTPAEFQPVASSMNIEFALASVNPFGSTSSGINRIKGSRTKWTKEDEKELKSLSYWPAENYINIWVCDLIDYRGYTQFPMSALPGVEISPTSRLTDGVMIDYYTFGSIDDGTFNLNPQYNKGRTLTHEMGHFFGLRHPWGDKDDCNGTDYVDDTPPQANATAGCPSNPVSECPQSAPVNKMFQNFLDLTSDECLNLFTNGQVQRMQIILENSPRRASLLIPKNAVTAVEFEYEKIFSPNGDGINDFWRWNNTLDFENCKLIIYNRSGKPVYEKTSYDNSWDGRSTEGQILEGGAYYFVVRCRDQEDIKGGVRLIR